MSWAGEIFDPCRSPGQDPVSHGAICGRASDLELADDATDHFDSIVYLEQGRHWLRSAAFFQALRQLGWPFRLLALARFLPLRLADAFYNAVASNRYRLFGRNDGTALPGQDLPGRYLHNRADQNR